MPPYIYKSASRTLHCSLWYLECAHTFHFFISSLICIIVYNEWSLHLHCALRQSYIYPAYSHEEAFRGRLSLRPMILGQPAGATSPTARSPWAVPGWTAKGRHQGESGWPRDANVQAADSSLHSQTCSTYCGTGIFHSQQGRAWDDPLQLKDVQETSKGLLPLLRLLEAARAPGQQTLN